MRLRSRRGCPTYSQSDATATRICCTLWCPCAAPSPTKRATKVNTHLVPGGGGSAWGGGRGMVCQASLTRICCTLWCLCAAPSPTKRATKVSAHLVPGGGGVCLGGGHGLPSFSHKNLLYTVVSMCCPVSNKESHQGKHAPSARGGGGC